ncbi:hypothetical protein FB45DRAFT_874264 [Roridomyces roridus]|uniref:Uncharacterized protein n=1 Tax=Roridomyces roridus TaxID=1738132 RepID=A0AAD7B9D2_9AGAR|nr:hypothetical protein FB45DRAFT_874264 [Roridomyces roridus]
MATRLPAPSTKETRTTGAIELNPLHRRYLKLVGWTAKFLIHPLLIPICGSGTCSPTPPHSPSTGTWIIVPGGRGVGGGGGGSVYRLRPLRLQAPPHRQSRATVIPVTRDKRAQCAAGLRALGAEAEAQWALVLRDDEVTWSGDSLSGARRVGRASGGRGRWHARERVGIHTGGDTRIHEAQRPRYKGGDTWRVDEGYSSGSLVPIPGEHAATKRRIKPAETAQMSLAISRPPGRRSIQPPCVRPPRLSEKIVPQGEWFQLDVVTEKVDEPGRWGWGVGHGLRRRVGEPHSSDASASTGASLQKAWTRTATGW